MFFKIDVKRILNIYIYLCFSILLKDSLTKAKRLGK